MPTIRTQDHRRIRRQRLINLAGGVLVVVAGGVVWRAIDQKVLDPLGGEAFAPWRTWRDFDTGPEKLVAAAILASNAHNTQPWIFDVTETRIDLYADSVRSVGTVDPFLRERDISLGCALENIVQAAGSVGAIPTITLQPDPTDPSFFARIDLAPGVPTPSALASAIPDRHTNRYPF